MASDAEDMPASAAAAANYWHTDAAAADLLRSIGAVASEPAEAGDDDGPAAGTNEDSDDDEEEVSEEELGMDGDDDADDDTEGHGEDTDGKDSEHEDSDDEVAGAGSKRKRASTTARGRRGGAKSSRRSNPSLAAGTNASSASSRVRGTSSAFRRRSSRVGVGAAADGANNVTGNNIAARARGRSSSSGSPTASVGTTNGAASSASTRRSASSRRSSRTSGGATGTGTATAVGAAGAAGGGATAASADGSAVRRPSRRGTSATTFSEEMVTDQCAECEAWRHVTSDRAKYMWICHDIDKSCDGTNDDGIDDENRDHDKDGSEDGWESGSEDDSRSDDGSDDVNPWKSDLYRADFSQDALTKHIPVVQHGEQSLLQLGPLRRGGGATGGRYYLCRAVDCGKKAKYSPDPLCTVHQREKDEGRTCHGGARPNESWSPVKCLLLASEEEYFLDPPNTIRMGSKVIAQSNEYCYEEVGDAFLPGVVESIDGDDIVVKYDADGEIETLSRERVRVKLASYSSSEKSKTVEAPLNGPPSDADANGTRSTTASANSGAAFAWTKDDIDAFYQSIIDKVRENDVDPSSEEGRRLVSEAILLLQKKNAESKKSMSMNAVLDMEEIKRMWRYRDVAMKNCNLYGRQVMLSFDTLMSNMTTILGLDRSVIESMMPCDEEHWHSDAAYDSSTRKYHLTAFCLNAVAYFQGNCGAHGCDGCGINFRDMTIKDRSKIDYHHLDESTKYFQLSLAFKYPSFVIVEELHKCVATCSNCHRGETHYQRQARYEKRKGMR